jgi:outer membrane lipoprotein-sorting protein
MTDTRLWDRAAAVVAVDGRRRPAIVALPAGLPSLEELFEFMRDAESRFATLRLRIDERRQTSRGEVRSRTEVQLQHPGAARVLTSDPDKPIGGDYEMWISDGDLVRTYASAHKLGTQRPIRTRPRGLADQDFPGAARVYEPVTALPFETLADTFIHPAGFCQNVLSTGRTYVTGTDVVNGREAILVECVHPRTTQLAGDRPDFDISLAVDRELGIIVRLTESIAGTITRQADAVEVAPDAPLAPSTFRFEFPTGTTMLY